ncbi:hypothetical protein [Cerasicoccus frondis]|uniref:hypothetical protein n=1 Tax=Cerasicoccus frondis TaxID=490090 RepID=UPI0028529DCA|nr:hypothetical protein [Cerasicoccus frondis]
MNISLFFEPNSPHMICRIQRIRKMLDALHETANDAFVVDIAGHLAELDQKYGNVRQCAMHDVLLGKPLSDEYSFFDYDGLDSIEYAIEFHYLMHFDDPDSLQPSGDCSSCDQVGSMDCAYH